MSRIELALGAVRALGRPAIIPFVTAGFPASDSTVPVVEALARGGADLVEIGIPFSDPLADGPTIQRSSERALANGMRLEHVLGAVRELRSGETTAPMPIILMGYVNPMLRYGFTRFLDHAAAAGVDGLIVPDLPPEEAAEYRQGCVDRGLAAIFLVAPNAPDERIELVDGLSTHFSYCVSITGVTGARGSVQDRTAEFLGRVRSLAAKPFVVGFGIKSAEHVARLGPLADGVVVGSALVDVLSRASEPIAAVEAKVRELREAADLLATGVGDER